ALDMSTDRRLLPEDSIVFCSVIMVSCIFELLVHNINNPTFVQMLVQPKTFTCESFGLATNLVSATALNVQCAAELHSDPPGAAPAFRVMPWVFLRLGSLPQILAGLQCCKPA